MMMPEIRNGLKTLWRSHSQMVLAGAVLLAVFATYSNVFGNAFLWDDEFLIQKNVFIRDFGHLPDIFSTCSGAGVGRLDNFYRPMQLLMYSIVYHLAGPRPWAFHLLNVLLHAGSGVLLFLFARRLAGQEPAFLAAVLWAVHPVHTEAVTYMSGTADPLSVLFALGSFLAYVRFREKRSGGMKWLGASGMLFILALLSKETMIILPLLFGLYEFVFLRDPEREKRFSWRRYRFITPLLAIAAVYFILRLTVLNFGGTLNLFEESNIYTANIGVRVMTFLASLPSYYSFLLFPVGLHMEREFPVFVSLFSHEVMASLIILAGLLLAAWKSAGGRATRFGILWFFIAFVPMSGIIPVNSLLLEHWLYFPAIGFFLAAGWLAFRLMERGYRKHVAVLLVAAVAFSAGLALQRNTDWRDPVVFYSNILLYNNGTARVHNNLAMAYADRGELKLAEEHYLLSLGIREYPQAHYNLARLYLREGRIQDAVAHLNRNIEINPNFFFSYHLLGSIYESMGEKESAEQYYRKAQESGYY